MRHFYIHEYPHSYNSCRLFTKKLMSESDDAGNDDYDDDIAPINMRTLHITFTHSKAHNTPVPFFFSIAMLLLLGCPSNFQATSYGTSLLLLYHTQHSMRDVCLRFCITHEWHVYAVHFVKVRGTSLFFSHPAQRQR